MSQAELRRCVLEADAPGARRLWAKVAAHLPQPASDHEALMSLHYLRAEAGYAPFRSRAYSHRWLLDHGMPSPLPDELRPRAERLHPLRVEGVGIAVGFTSELMRPIGGMVRAAMEDAVSEAYADGRTEPEFVKGRMQAARGKTVRQLVGVKE